MHLSTQIWMNPSANAGESGLIPGLGRSPGGGNGNSLQYSCLGNPTNREDYWVTVHGVAKSLTQLGHWALMKSQLQICEVKRLCWMEVTGQIVVTSWRKGSVTLNGVMRNRFKNKVAWTGPRRESGL